MLRYGLRNCGWLCVSKQCRNGADINLGETDALPVYLGLLVKDKKVAAITFYYPTAN